LLVLAVFGGFLAKSGHFAGHIFHDPLCIFAQFKVWGGRKPSELQSDTFGLCSKKPWFELEKSNFRFFSVFGPEYILISLVVHNGP
jgi:hypothetical protein